MALVQEAEVSRTGGRAASGAERPLPAVPSPSVSSPFWVLEMGCAHKDILDNPVLRKHLFP